MGSILMVGLLVSSAFAVSSDTPPTPQYDNYGGSIKVVFGNMTSITNTTAYTLPALTDSAFCQVAITNASVSDRVVTLQGSVESGTQFNNMTASHTLDPTDNDTLKFDVINRGVREVRFHVVSGTLDIATDIQPTCYFWRN